MDESDQIWGDATVAEVDVSVGGDQSVERGSGETMSPSRDASDGTLPTDPLPLLPPPSIDLQAEEDLGSGMVGEGQEEDEEEDEFGEVGAAGDDFDDFGEFDDELDDGGFDEAFTSPIPTLPIAPLSKVSPAPPSLHSVLSA